MRFLLIFLLFATAVFADSKLNFIVILADDLGATDLGCTGSKFYETPHLDRLAQEGVMFTQAHSACTVCSPTRAALVTGKYPARLHLTDWIAGHDKPKAKLRIPNWTKALPTAETTIANVLHDRGYATMHLGKWHLGPTPATAHGFDTTLADNGKGQPASYLSPYRNPNLTDGPDGEELTERLTAEAERFVEQQRERPFFLYLAHFGVHTPLGAKPEKVAKYRAKAATMEAQGNPAYAAMIEAIDDSVGRLRAKLEALGLTERTVFIFTSDNGGLTLGKPAVTANLGLRSGKGSAYHGGTRVPAICYWPGVSRGGSRSDVPVITMDWTASMAAATGEAMPCDGVDLRPLLRGESIPARAIFWHYPHYHPGGATPYSAIREGMWELLHFAEDDRVELYDLRQDAGQKTDVAAAESARTKSMRQRLDEWRRNVGAQEATPNPNYQP